MTTFKCKMTLERETKNAYRYQEVQTGYIGTLYAQKASFGAAKPKEIEVEVSFDENDTADV